jgi:hypothetical protein
MNKVIPYNDFGWLGKISRSKISAIDNQCPFINSLYNNYPNAIKN